MDDVHITVATEVAPRDAERFHELYEAAFGRLRTLGAARQVLHRDEFFHEMSDPRVVKYVVWDSGDRPIGMTALSADLSTVPWISPEFFAALYPEQASRHAIYYVHFMLAHPDARLSRAFDCMFTALFTLFEAERAVSLFDICSYNNDTYRFAENLARRAQGSGSVTVTAVDTQTYYSAVFDVPQAVAPEARPSRSLNVPRRPVRLP